MATQHKTSTGALIAIVAVVALLLAYIMMENGGEPLDPASTAALPADMRTELSEEPEVSDETISALNTDTPARATAPAVSTADVDATLAELDAALNETEYDASSVTELFEEDVTSELTESYEL